MTSTNIDFDVLPVLISLDQHRGLREGAGWELPSRSWGLSRFKLKS